MQRVVGVLDAVEVLDLSWGIAGPMATMVLADHGARVKRIERPEGDPFATLAGSRVWGRGKHTETLDASSEVGRSRLLKLARRADVLIESFSPGTTAALGIDFETIHELNPKLIYCSITGYGHDTKDAQRPGYDALVAARTGQQWDSRGMIGGTIDRLSGGAGMMPGLEAPEGCWVGADRPGPLFSGVPWPSIAAFYLATLGISAALRARESTGRGQWVQTSLLQGVLATTMGSWQRVERPEVEHFQTWVIDPRAPKGFFLCSDGRWIHNWVPLPGFILGAAHGDSLEVREGVASPKKSELRIGTDPHDMVLLQHFHPEMAAAVRRFSADQWTHLAAKVGVPLQPVRSPEEALADPFLVSEGCVVEVDDPDLGPIRQVGQVYRLAACPNQIPGAATATPGAPEIRVKETQTGAKVPKTALSAPLEGVRVLDLGLAVAGPFGTQLLGDLGAEVIKVSTFTDHYWMTNHIAMSCNRGKRSIAVNLKTEDGLKVLHALVRSADVVQHNMRYDAAERLGVDYASLAQVNPKIVYCHCRGFEEGPRMSLPGNDQTGAALAGTEWLDGGMDRGGSPLWSLQSMGDTGNGFLSAIGIVQALYHRDRTGEGQFLSTSILYAQLLNASNAWVSADGRHRGDRQRLDAMQLGWHALYRLYEGAEGWLCLAALTEDHWHGLTEAIGRPELAQDRRFATAAGRSEHDDQLVEALTEVFRQSDAASWWARLDAAGVPCEVSDPDFVLGLFDDPEMRSKGWVTSYHHPLVGQMDCMGLLFDLSDTPGKIAGPAFLPGQHTRQILSELGYGDQSIDRLLDTGAVQEAPN